MSVRQTSGSLGCLDSCGMAGVPDMESALNQRLGQVNTESGSNEDAPAGSRVTINERTVTWAEPRIKVIPPNSSRSVLMAMHTEYTRQVRYQQYNAVSLAYSWWILNICEWNNDFYSLFRGPAFVNGFLYDHLDDVCTYYHIFSSFLFRIRHLQPERIEWVMKNLKKCCNKLSVKTLINNRLQNAGPWNKKTNENHFEIFVCLCGIVVYLISW